MSARLETDSAVVAAVYAAWSSGDWRLEHFSPEVDWALVRLLTFEDRATAVKAAGREE